MDPETARTSNLNLEGKPMKSYFLKNSFPGPALPLGNRANEVSISGKQKRIESDATEFLKTTFVLVMSPGTTCFE